MKATKAWQVLRLVLLLLGLALFRSLPVADEVRAAPPVPVWLDLKGPDGPVRAAVFRPSGSRPFPVLVFLHGAYGIDQVFLDWASRFVTEGYGVLVGCYARHSELPPHPGWSGAAVRCPQLPPPYSDSFRNIEAAKVLMDAARQIPGARSASLALIGWSLGAGVATDAASTGADLRAVVAISGGEYDPHVARLRAPVLLLHGKRDDVVSVESAVEYRAVLRAARKKVVLVLYDNGDHFLPFTPPTIGDDVHSRVVGFLRRYLQP